MLKILIPFCLLLLSLPLASPSSNHRLYEIEKLLKRFDYTVDVNFLYYDIYRSQKKNPLLCKAEYGPYCSMINHKSITSGVLDSHENLQKEARKKAVIFEYDKLRDKNIFGLSNTERDKLLQPFTSVEELKEAETLLTFEEAILNTEDAEITNALIWNRERGFLPEITKPAEMSKNDVKVTFQGIYLPAAAKVTDKKTMSDKAKMDKENEGKDLKEHKPVSVYAYSKTTEGGEINFSRAVIVKQIWARKHNMDVHEEDIKAQGKTNKYLFEFDIKGQKNGKNVVGFKKSWTDMITTWTLLKPVTENVAVDKLVIPKNTDLDNILLEIGLEDEIRLMTLAEYHDLIAHIQAKYRNFANLEDEDLRNDILADEARVFLRKRNFEERFIRRMVDNLVVKKLPNNNFDIHFEEVESFVEKFVLYKNFHLVVGPGESKKIKDRIKAALKDSTKKGPEFQDLTEEHLRELLEKMDIIDFDQYDQQQLILQFMFEEKKEDQGVNLGGENTKKAKQGGDL